jgi:hypothetical protein
VLQPDSTAQRWSKPRCRGIVMCLLPLLTVQEICLASTDNGSAVCRRRVDNAAAYGLPRARVLTNPNPTATALLGPLSLGQFSLTVLPQGSGTVTLSPYTNRFTSGTQVTRDGRSGCGPDFYRLERRRQRFAESPSHQYEPKQGHHRQLHQSPDSKYCSALEPHDRAGFSFLTDRRTWDSLPH